MHLRSSKHRSERTVPGAATRSAERIPRVLMVDDDLELCRMVVRYLARDGFDARAVNSGPQALQAVRSSHYDVMILDVMMPGMNGHDVLREIAASSGGVPAIPVLMLTARGDEIDRIAGLEIGADDYLAKPCSLRELAARLRAILRRTVHVGTASAHQPPTLTAGDVTLDSVACRATREFIEGEYHHTPRRGLEGKTPLEQWALVGDQLRFPDGDLDNLVLFETKRRVMNDRTVSLNGRVCEVDAVLVVLIVDDAQRLRPRTAGTLPASKPMPHLPPVCSIREIYRPVIRNKQCNIDGEHSTLGQGVCNRCHRPDSAVFLLHLTGHGLGGHS